MREWIPVSTSPKGRLALAAVREFGTRAFADVTVGELAAAADVTTGAIYHHFGSKLGLYQFVRTDVERRLLDRMEGAASASPDGGPIAALLVGFDFAVGSDFSRLLGEPPSGRDTLVDLISRLAAPSAAPLGSMLTAAWRAAVLAVAEGADTLDARSALLAMTPQLPPNKLPEK